MPPPSAVDRLVGWNTVVARRLTARWRPFPDFVIIGAQRAGTTSLSEWIMAQPRARSPRTWELHYFDLNFDRGNRWYRANFPWGRAGQVTGESTPYMLFHPLAPERAAHCLPSTTRFIVLLRDPVERAISQYWLNRRRNHETASFREAIESEDRRLDGQEELVLGGGHSLRHDRYSYVARGHYAEQLTRWFDHVPRQRFLILQSEELFASADVANGVLDWLGLEPSDRPFPQGNQAVRHQTADADVVDRLHRHFEPHNRRLENLLGRPFWPA